MLSAARTGAEWAWRELYRSTASDLLRYASARGARDPEDLVGDVFLRAVRGLESFEGDERAFRAWLFTLSRNLAIDRYRTESRRHTIPVPNEALALLGPTGDAEAEAFAGIAEERIGRLLQRLTADQRDVLLLRILAGLTIDEIASVVGKRPGAVKALQARGVRAIQADLALGTVTL